MPRSRLPRPRTHRYRVVHRVPRRRLGEHPQDHLIRTNQHPNRHDRSSQQPPVTAVGPLRAPACTKWRVLGLTGRVTLHAWLRVRLRLVAEPTGQQRRQFDTVSGESLLVRRKPLSPNELAAA